MTQNLCLPLVTRRRIGPRIVAMVDPLIAPSGAGAGVTQIYRLSGLRGCFRSAFMVGILNPARPSRQYNNNANFDILAAGGNVQGDGLTGAWIESVYPFVGVNDNEVTRLKGVFMGTIAGVNTDAEQSQSIPFSWEFETMADEVSISVVVMDATARWSSSARAAGGGPPYACQLALWAVVEYVGPSSDPIFVKSLLDAVKLNDFPTHKIGFLGVP